MVTKFATKTGSEVSKQRPPGIENDRVRSEVGVTESGNAGNIPNSTVNLTNINNIFWVTLLFG